MFIQPACVLADGCRCSVWQYRLCLLPKILRTRSVSDLGVWGFGNIYMNVLSIPNLKIPKPKSLNYDLNSQKN